MPPAGLSPFRFPGAFDTSSVFDKIGKAEPSPKGGAEGRTATVFDDVLSGLILFVIVVPVVRGVRV